MKLVTFTSFKGGAGKSTALMAAVPGLLAAGKRLALLEADENDTLALWRANARARSTWDERVAIHEATDLNVFETSYAAARTAGADIALVDSRGGASELNTAILAASDLILIPTSLTTIDMDGALSTFQFVLGLIGANGLEIPVALMMTRFPTYRLNASERESVEILSRVPQMTAQLPLRHAFAEIQALGMLHLHAARLREAGSIAARHIEIALREAEVVSQDILDTLYEVEATEARHADQTA